jgi:lipoyl(octanoyl) transferase
MVVRTVGGDRASISLEQIAHRSRRVRLTNVTQTLTTSPSSELTLVRAGVVEYLTAWEEQRRLHEQVADGAASGSVLLLQHPSVYTAGKRTEPLDRPQDGTPVIDVDRGGKITWHGPGQLVGYPIVRLPDPVDVVAYVRRVEQLLIDTCADLGLATTRIEGRSGVWVPADDPGPGHAPGAPRAGQRPDRKVAAIGIRVARGVTLHGFALNCDCDLGAYDAIVPCGIRDAGVTSLSTELGRPVTVDEVIPIVERHLRTTLLG